MRIDKSSKENYLLNVSQNFNDQTDKVLESNEKINDPIFQVIEEINVLIQELERLNAYS
jgi:flagellar hook-associated protein FlgK